MRPRALRGDPNGRSWRSWSGRAVLAMLLLVPLASAAVPFVLEYEDPVGDSAAPSVDIVRVTSNVSEGLVTQRVEMAAPPDLDQDTVILRSWFDNSTNGSFHVLDLEIHAHSLEEAKFKALVRRGDFENVTEIEATWAVVGNAWEFTFSEEPFLDATCFDPIVWAQHEPLNEAWSVDQGGIGTRYCRVRGDPSPAPAPTSPFQSRPPREPFVNPPSSSGAPLERVAAPGSDTPAVSPWLVAAVAGIVVFVTYRTWRKR